jgi:hypothetical protein
MISLQFSLTNPWSSRFNNLKHWSGYTPFRNKFWELELLQDASILTCELFITSRRDHAGVSIELGLLGYSVHFTFYDNRHWNYRSSMWEKHE